MNIGIFTDTYTPQINGVVVSVETLAKGLRDRGHNVYIFTVKDPKLNSLAAEDSHDEYVYRLQSIPVPFSPEHRLAVGYYRKLYRKVKELNLDVIHTQTEFTLGILGKMYGKKLNIPVIHTYHTMWADYAHYITRTKNEKINLPISIIISKLSKTFCNKTNAVICPSIKAKNALLNYGVKKPIIIIPTGLNLELFKNKISMYETMKLKKELGIKNFDKVVLFIGRVAEEKSIDVIIKEFDKVLSKINNAKLLIVGDGPARNELEHLTKKLKLDDNIIFAGKHPYEEISKFYKLSDVFVNASTSETQGLTYIEAMATGIPIVAKFDNNLSGIIKDDYSGSLFTDDDEFSEKIIKILTDKNYRDTIIKGASLIPEDYSFNAFIDRVEVVYQSLIIHNNEE